MQICARCQKSLTTGGKWDGPLRYCSKECLDAGPTGSFALQNLARNRRPRGLESSPRAMSGVWRARTGGRAPEPLGMVRSRRDVVEQQASGVLHCVCSQSIAQGHCLHLASRLVGFPVRPESSRRFRFPNVRALMRSTEKSRPSPELVRVVGLELIHNALVSAGEASLRSTGH